MNSAFYFPNLSFKKALSVGLLLCSLLGVGFLLAGSSFIPTAQARMMSGYGFSPQSYKSGYTYGNGIYFAPYQFTVYTEPRKDAPKIGDFKWGRKNNSNRLDVIARNGDHVTVAADHVFFCFYPQLDVAMLAVTGDDGNGWLEVIYDQGRKKAGWINTNEAQPNLETLASASNEASPSQKASETPAHFGVYQTWIEFMKLNAKANGIYWLSGVKEYNRSLRSSDTDEAKLLPVTIIRDLKVRHVRGNWLLVEVLDFQRNTPIGWIRWRDDDGNLMVFPNISGQKTPILTTAH